MNRNRQDKLIITRRILIRPVDNERLKFLAIVFIVIILFFMYFAILIRNEGFINVKSEQVNSMEYAEYGAISNLDLSDVLPDVSRIESWSVKARPTATVSYEEESKEDETKQTQDVLCYSEQDAIDIAKVLYRECRGVRSKTEQACVVWTILNRVDNDDSSVYSVVRAPHQFAFKEGTKVDDELLELAYDVLERWNMEKCGETNVGRVLPKKYMWFGGRNGHNYFRDRFRGEFKIWDYSLSSPYQN